MLQCGHNAALVGPLHPEETLDPSPSFGDWLQQRRKAQGLLGEQLAQRVGCSISTLRKLEAGERRPSLQIAELLANALDLPPAVRPTFLKVARGELNVERLPPPTPQYAQPAPPAPTTRPARDRLPVNPTPLIGRQQELAELGRLLADPACRLLTLVGPGGVGKTRLAIRAARQAAETFVDGVAFVPLAPLTSASFVIPAMAEALDFGFSGPTDVRTQLMHFLRDKQLLLVLDSAEHLLAEGMAELLAELRTQAPAMTLLVTSHEVLDLQAEWVFEVHGLPVSERRPNGAAREDAVELFRQRAHRAHVGFNWGPEDDPAIVRICQLVDGMPLAIELAASWVRTLSCAEIAAELEHGLDVLATSARDRPARHRSMGAVCDYSWSLLSDGERRVMRRLSVFRGGFRREAAEQVATATLALLSALVSKSWLRHTSGERYEIHELLLQYAAARLAEDPDEEAQTRRQHARYYLAWLGGQEVPLKDADQLAAAARVTADFKNVRAAWAWAVENRSVVDLLAGSRSLSWFMELRSLLQEAADCFQRAVDALDLPSEAQGAAPREWRLALAQSLEQLGYYRLRIGLADSRTVLERSLALLSPDDPSNVRTDAQRDYGVTLYMTGDFENGSQCLRAALRTYQDQNDYWAIGGCYFHLGNAARIQGRDAEAAQLFRDSLAAVRNLGDPPAVCVRILTFLTGVLCAQGAYAEAARLAAETLERSRSIGDRYAEAEALYTLGLTAHAEQNSVPALARLQDSLEMFEAFPDKWSVARVANAIGQVQLDRGETQLAQQAFGAALTAAHETQTLPQVLAALAGLAETLLRAGEVERVVEVTAQILRHPAANPDVQASANALASRAQAQLSPAQLEVIRRQVEARPFETFVAALPPEATQTPPA